MTRADRRRSPASTRPSTRSPRSRSSPTRSATACGVIVFDREIRRRLATRRSGGRAVVQAILDVEPRLVDSDYDLAFRAVGGGKRGLVIVFTDLVDEAAARSLLAAVPVLARRHAVVVASVTDPDLQRRDDPRARVDPRRLRQLRSRSTCSTRARASRRDSAASGAVVIEAPPRRLGEACVGAYLRLKAQPAVTTRLCTAGSCASVRGRAEPEHAAPEERRRARRRPTSTVAERLSGRRDEAFDEAGDDEPTRPCRAASRPRRALPRAAPRRADASRDR